MYSTRLGPHGPHPQSSVRAEMNEMRNQCNDLLASTLKALEAADSSLADLFSIVDVLTERLIGGLPLLAEDHERLPHEPGALNEILWRATVHGRHGSVLRDRLSTLLQVL